MSLCVTLRHVLLGTIVSGLTLSHAAVADESRPIPIGLDAYREWERWPELRIGMRTYLRSTYDRAGGNEGADAGHFLYQEAEDFNVTLDVEGPGLLTFVRTNHWHGSPWHDEVDGVDHLVQESSSADPTNPVEGSTFLPAELFPEPLAWTWATTRGADLSWVPIPFEKSFRMAYSRTRYGTGYYIFQKYLPGLPISRPIQSWDGATPPDADVLELIARSGSDLAPRPESPEGRRLGVVRESGTRDLPAGSTVELLRLDQGPRTLRAIELSAPSDQAIPLGRTRIRVTWDDRSEPSVEAPVSLFFGAGTLYNRDERESLVKAFPVHVRFADDRVHLACYFPMPFFDSARIELIGPDSQPVTDVRWSVRHQPFTGAPEGVGYFHATYRDHPEPEPGLDLVLLETRDIEGSTDWTGHLVGTSFIFTHKAVLTTLEGDPRFFFDDSQTPQVQGTGTEEWGGGGDYWGGRTMSLPFAGHPVGAPKAEQAQCDEDLIHSAYRFLLADLMPFGRNARIGLEHGGMNTSTEHYETVTYWYGRPGASLVTTDTLHVGDRESEQAHDYQAPGASDPYEIHSRYEWGVDQLGGREIYPAHTDRGRVTTSGSEFTLRLDPRNSGVLLRRKLDYAFPHQRALIEIADAGQTVSGSDPTWQSAGVWYLAGSNTCVYSNPPGELDLSRPIVQTSNRRFRDDEFLIGPELTRGRTAIRVRVKPLSAPHRLLPRFPLSEPAWSEIRYDADCFLTPGS